MLSISDSPFVGNSVIGSIQDKITKELIEKEDSVMEFYLRNKVVPPIKGAITKGKLKYRGLRIGVFNAVGNTSRYLMQRDKQIGLLSRFTLNEKGYSIEIPKL